MIAVIITGPQGVGMIVLHGGDTMILAVTDQQVLELQSGSLLSYIGFFSLSIRNIIIVYGNTKDQLIDRVVEVLGRPLRDPELQLIARFFAGQRTDRAAGKEPEKQN